MTPEQDVEACANDDTEWPCDASLLLAALDAARADRDRLRETLETAIAALNSLAEHSERGAVPLSAQRIADAFRAALKGT